METPPQYRRKNQPSEFWKTMGGMNGERLLQFAIEKRIQPCKPPILTTNSNLNSPIRGQPWDIESIPIVSPMGTRGLGGMARRDWLECYGIHIIGQSDKVGIFSEYELISLAYIRTSRNKKGWKEEFMRYPTKKEISQYRQYRLYVGLWRAEQYRKENKFRLPSKYVGR